MLSLRKGLEVKFPRTEWGSWVQDGISFHACQMIQF